MYAILEFADRLVRNYLADISRSLPLVLTLGLYENYMAVIQSQEEWVLFRLDKFYSNINSLSRVKDILEGNSSLSLRLIDWFVTNYSKKYNVSYMTSSKKHIVVYLSYKSHLKAYSKKMFDPFCRWRRIKFHDFETNVGQLNFFEWAIQDEVLDYI